MSGCPNIIVFVDGDFTVFSSGSHIRFADCIDYARRNFSDVTVYSYRQHATAPWTPDGEERFARRFPGIPLVMDDVGRKVTIATRLKNIAAMLFPGKASKIVAWSIDRETPRLREILADPGNLLIVNFTDGLTIINGAPAARVIIDTHDIKFIRRAKVTETPLSSVKSLFRIRSEIGLLSSVKAVIAISAVEIGVYRALLAEVPSFFIPSFSIPCGRTPSTTTSDIDILFVGSNNAFNVKGLCSFVRENHEALTRYSVAICGSVCDAEEIRMLQQLLPNLQLRGFVDDLEAIYDASKVVISPVDGTGLNIKVVEALRYGKPVFASDHSRHALPDGYERCVFSLDLSMIERLLDDAAARQEAGQSALEYTRAISDRADLKELTGFIVQSCRYSAVN